MDSPETTADIDAVICTRNRHDKIAQAVASVLACEHRSFTLTVVDQSTTSETHDALATLLATDSRLRYHHSELPGLSRAYNTAVSLTTSPILAFTDDDCIVPADWLSSIEAAFGEDAEADLLYGQVLPLVREPEDRSLVPWLPIAEPGRMGPGDRFRVFGMGANFAARRRVFESAGRFDEILGGGGPLRSSQDYDLAYRTWRSGGTIILRPEVWIEHDGRREKEDWPALLAAYGIGDGAFYSKHVRCRDPYAMWLLLRQLSGVAARLLANLVRRRPLTKARYLAGVFSGVRAGFKFEVDRERRLYVERTA